MSLFETAAENIQCCWTASTGLDELSDRLAINVTE